MEYSKEHPVKNLLNPLGRTSKQLMGRAMGYIHPRVMGAVSNPLMEIQAGGNAPQIFEGFRQGIAGERQGNLGDPIAKTLYRSKFADRHPYMAAGLITGGKVGGEMATYYSIGKGIKMLNKMRPRIHTQGEKGWFVKRAKGYHRKYVLERTKLKGKYDTAYEPSNSNVVPKSEVDDLLKKMPKAARKEYLKELAGKKQITVQDIRTANEKLSRGISDGSYKKLYVQHKDPSVIQQQLIQTKKGLKDLGLKYSNESTRKAVTGLDPQWKALETHGKDLDRLMYDASKDTFKTKGIKYQYGAKGDEGVRAARKASLKQFKPLKEELKSLSKYTQREGLKQGSKAVAPWLAGGGAIGGAAYWLKKTFGN